MQLTNWLRFADCFKTNAFTCGLHFPYFFVGTRHQILRAFERYFSIVFRRIYRNEISLTIILFKKATFLTQTQIAFGRQNDQQTFATNCISRRHRACRVRTRLVYGNNISCWFPKDFW